jgi:hypothetical protein
MAIRNQLLEIFKSAAAGPFLFVGSGFSRRYLDLPDWKGLLEQFCVAGHPVEYYLGKANGNMPAATQLLAEEFNEHWWQAAEYKASVARYKSKVRNVTSALRLEICAYLLTLDQTKAKQSQYAKEVELLASLNVDGVITTNWDLFVEQLFPDYKTYIGQEQLLFANPQQIGEIYKIHGCATLPESLVLTEKDYAAFRDRNAYLAAKLITLFVEHPIVFIGYSISDPNVNELLRAISLCIGVQNVEKLRRNLIFVQTAKTDETEGVSDTYLTIDGVQIPLILVRTNDFIPIYEAMHATKRKIPARVLRYCKEQLYELVQSAEPEKKLCVVDIDEIDNKEDVEFLVGVGVASRPSSTIAQIGYAPIKVLDLIADLLHEDRNYDAKQVIEHVVPDVGRNTPSVPVFKYLHAIGIDSAEKYKESELKLDKWVTRDLKDFRVKAYATPFFRTFRHQTMANVIESSTPENASAYIPFIAKDKIDINLLREFLTAHESKMDYGTSSYASNFRKLAALYDKLNWGW